MWDSNPQPTDQKSPQDHDGGVSACQEVLSCLVRAISTRSPCYLVHSMSTRPRTHRSRKRRCAAHVVPGERLRDRLVWSSGQLGGCSSARGSCVKPLDSRCWTSRYRLSAIPPSPGLPRGATTQVMPRGAAWMHHRRINSALVRSDGGRFCGGQHSLSGGDLADHPVGCIAPCRGIRSLRAPPLRKALP